MEDPTLLFGVGATKAGTSWLYRYLHDHPDCALRAVKEVHYFDTFEDEAKADQIAVFTRRIAQFRRQRAEAEAAERGWQVANMERRIADLGDLIAMLERPRDNDAAYAGYLMGRAGPQTRLVADITPNYAMLPSETYARMARVSQTTRFLYLIREPVARLWSHVRMQAQRFRQDHEVFEEKANNILWRILHKGHETHVLARGDYPDTVARLSDAVPRGRLLVDFAEAMFTPAGLERICDFLGIAYREADGGQRIHEGPKAEMREDLLPKAARFLKDHYEWAARTMGPLPPQWQANYERALA